MATVSTAKTLPYYDVHSWKSSRLLIVILLILMNLVEPGATATRVVATAPVNPVEENGILSVRFEVQDLISNTHDVTLLRTVNGDVQRISIGEDVLTKVGDKVFLATRHMGDGSVVYFLSIINVLRTEDEGAYSCSVRETVSGNEIAASSIRVNVTYFPSESDPMCNHVPTKVSVGTLMTLNCSSELGFPRVTVAWSRAGSQNLPTAINSEADRLYATSSFRVTQNDNSAVFLCSISSKQFPGLNRQCHVGPITVLSASGVIPYNSVTRGAEPTTTATSHGEDKSSIDSIPGTKPTLFQKCRDVCPDISSPPTLYWIVATVMAFIVAILFLVIVCVLISKYYRLSNQKYPIYTAAQPQPGEKIYAELNNRRSDNKVYMTLEKSDNPMRQKYLFKSDLTDHYHVTPSGPNP